MSAELGLGYSDIQQASKAINEATKELQQFQNQLNKTEQAQSRAESATKRGSSATESATKTTEGFTNALDSLGEMGGPVGSAANALKSVVEAGSGLGKVSGGLVGVATTAAGAALALTAVAAGASIFATLEFNTQFKELEQLANQYGLTTTEAMALRATMEAAGVEIDDYAGAIGDLTEKLGKSGDEGKKVRDAIKDLGVTTEDLQNPTQVMSDLTSALYQKMEDGTLTAKEATAAQSLLGEEWRKGVIAVVAMREAQERLNEFQRLGIEVNKDAASASKDFSKATADLSLIMDVFGSDVVAKNLPIITKWTELIVDSYKEGGTFKRVLDGMKDSANGFLNAIDRGQEKLRSAMSAKAARDALTEKQYQKSVAENKPELSPFIDVGGRRRVRTDIPGDNEYNARMAQIDYQEAQGLVLNSQAGAGRGVYSGFSTQAAVDAASGSAGPRKPTTLEGKVGGSGRVEQDPDKAKADKAAVEAKKQEDLQKRLNELFDEQKRRKDEIFGVDRQRAELESKALALMSQIAQYQGEAGKSKLAELTTAYDYNQQMIAKVDAERQLLGVQQAQSQELARMTQEYARQQTTRQQARDFEDQMRYSSSSDRELFARRIQLEREAAAKIIDIQQQTSDKVDELKRNRFDIQYPTGNTAEPAKLSAADNEKLAGIDARIQALDSGFMAKRDLIMKNKVDELKDVTSAYERAALMSNSFVDGFNKGILKLNDNLGTISSRTDQLTVQMGSALSDHLANALATGTFGAVDFFKTLRGEIAKLIIDLMVMQPLMETIRRATGASSNTGQKGMGLGGVLMNLATTAITGGLMSSTPVSTNVNGFGSSVIDAGAAWDAGMAGMPAFDYGAINQPMASSLAISVDVSGSGGMSAQNADIIGSQVAQAAMRAIAREEATGIVQDGVRYGGVIRNAMSN